MDISEGLFQVAGFFERYSKTGGLVSAMECRFLANQLNSLAAAARAQAIAAKATEDEFDRYIETSGAPVDKRPVRAFSIIQAGAQP